MKLRRFKLGQNWTALIIPVLLFVALYLFYVYNYGSLERSPDIPRNYFRLALSKGKYLVKNDKCEVPDLNPWYPELQSLLEPLEPFKCDKIELTYLENGKVVINITKIPELGYEANDLLCCYHVIHRFEQTEQNFDKDADNQYRFSKRCYPMEPQTRPINGFIKVVCSVNYLLMDYVVYENFHLIAMFPDDDKTLKKKRLFWRNYSHSGEVKTTTDSPPNILLIGIDSTSRLNFHRFMHKSIQLLKNELQAIEMNGYTKVGENTFPNLVALLSSFSVDELSKICYAELKPQDNCPYIWKKFSDLYYLTAHLEDCPQISIFNFQKTGFIRKPVDMYIRPWMYAAYSYKESEDCIGTRRPEEIVLNYMTDLVALSEFHKIPYLITTWLTDLTHNQLSNIQRMDLLLENTLQKLHIKGYLNNTLLIVMSDHGYRYGDVRLTPSGWFEDKLPFMYLKLPNALVMEHPAWLEALKHNSKQLLTPFNVHATLKEMLNLANRLTGSNLPTERETMSYNFTLPPLRGLSLFQFLPPRTCKEAGVPKAYCPCSPLSPFTGNYSLIERGAQEILNVINAKLPTVCANLKIARISAYAVLSNHQDVENSTIITDFVISLETDPGKFAYEAVVTLNEANGHFANVTNILRTSRLYRKVPCLSEEEAASELYCYCK